MIRENAITDISYLIVRNGGGKVARRADAVDIDRSCNTDNYDPRFRNDIDQVEIPSSRNPKFLRLGAKRRARRETRINSAWRQNCDRASKIFA